MLAVIVAKCFNSSLLSTPADCVSWIVPSKTLMLTPWQQDADLQSTLSRGCTGGTERAELNPRCDLNPHVDNTWPSLRTLRAVTLTLTLTLTRTRTRTRP